MDKKIEKKRTKILARIAELENYVLQSLTKKASNKNEISLPQVQKELAELNAQLKLLK